MNLGCDVCQNLRPEASSRFRGITSVSFDEGTVVLCEAHRRIAERSGVTTFADLREFYREPNGRRSYVPRRIHPPASASDAAQRRRGRRATDV